MMHGSLNVKFKNRPRWGLFRCPALGLFRTKA